MYITDVSTRATLHDENKYPVSELSRDEPGSYRMRLHLPVSRWTSH
jgi:hypothetical protein